MTPRNVFPLILIKIDVKDEYNINNHVHPYTRVIELQQAQNKHSRFEQQSFKSA